MPTYHRMTSGTFWPGQDHEGTSIEGEFIRPEIAPGQFGDQVLLLIQEPDGELWKVSVTAKLQDIATRMQIGRRYRLIYKGRATSKSGRTFKNIVVDRVTNDGETLSDDTQVTEESPSPDTATDDEVPF